MAQEMKEQVQDKEQNAKQQRANLRSRIRNIATKVIKGDFNQVNSTSPYQPQKVQDADHPEWQTLMNNQENLMKRIAAAKDVMDGGLSRHQLIISLRGDFPDIAKKIPEPVKPKAKSVTPPPALATSNQQDAKKRKQITLDDDDDDDEEYDPNADGRAQREERATKRQRSVAQEATTITAEAKPMMDEEDLEIQIEEIQMKADLAKLQLKRKFAADKKKREQMGAKIKKEQV